jgi:hypothetical protein
MSAQPDVGTIVRASAKAKNADRTNRRGLIWVRPPGPERTYEAILAPWLETILKAQDGGQIRCPLRIDLCIATVAEAPAEVEQQAGLLALAVANLKPRFQTLKLSVSKVSPAFGPGNCVFMFARDGEESNVACYADRRLREFCHGRSLLACIAADGRAFPCFGALQERANAGIEADALGVGESFGLLGGRCLECGHAHAVAGIPCRRPNGLYEDLADNALEWNRTYGCNNQAALSIDELATIGRESLERILWAYDFEHGQKILVDPEKERDPKQGLVEFWPTKGQCPIDIAWSRSAALPHYLKTNADETLFLARAFAPVMMKALAANEDAWLLSVIFVARAGKSHLDRFFYRSIYALSSPASPGGKVARDEAFLALWRWPAYDDELGPGGGWSDWVANLSSNFLVREDGKGRRLPYVLALRHPRFPMRLQQRACRTIVVPLYVLASRKTANHVKPVRDRARALRTAMAASLSGDRLPIYQTLANDYFVNPLAAEDEPWVPNLFDALLSLYPLDGGPYQNGILQRRSVLHYVLEGMADFKGGWKSLENEKKRQFRKLINYFIWLLSLDPDLRDLGAIEAFHVSMPPSDKQPGGAVVYSTEVLPGSSSASILSALNQLMTPIEQTYLRHENMLKDRAAERGNLVPLFAHAINNKTVAVMAALNAARSVAGARFRGLLEKVQQGAIREGALTAEAENSVGVLGLPTRMASVLVHSNNALLRSYYYEDLSETAAKFWKASASVETNYPLSQLVADALFTSLAAYFEKARGQGGAFLAYSDHYNSVFGERSGVDLQWKLFLEQWIKDNWKGSLVHADYSDLRAWIAENLEGEGRFSTIDLPDIDDQPEIWLSPGHAGDQSDEYDIIRMGLEEILLNALKHSFPSSSDKRPFLRVQWGVARSGLLSLSVHNGHLNTRHQSAARDTGRSFIARVCGRLIGKISAHGVTEHGATSYRLDVNPEE